ncbi:MAG: hypothetical protein ACOYI8_08830 [Christensenellales bacterium]|jgi:ssDNA-binding Zn-finger/Zn-ribbon topoisomerase 1
MGFLQKLRYSLARFMTGRYGPDQLSQALTYASMALLILGLFPFIGILARPLVYVCLIFSIFRMMSKNPAKRIKENQWYLAHSGNIKQALSQHRARFRNRKEYKYFRCPKCRALLKLKRGSGEGTLTCGKCGNQFKQKA